MPAMGGVVLAAHTRIWARPSSLTPLLWFLFVCSCRAAASPARLDYFPAMELCSVSETRRTLEFAFNNRCKSENTPILEELVRLRAEQAEILGYPNHASYVLEIRMAKSPLTVGPFLRDLSSKLTPLMEEELRYWKQLKADEAKADGQTGPATTVEGQTIHPWDVRYLTRLSELLKYKVDDQAIKQYFPHEVVTAGLLDIYQRTLGMQFEEVKREAHSVWHPDVQLFRVKDKGSDKTRAFFYLDLFPREGKYGHAAVWGLRPGCAVSLEANTRQLPVAGMVANFTKPTPEQPSLLTHQEVVTYFHEFGHVAHQICSEVKFARFAGTSVERDFVEAPSQMLENWCYESEPLLLMSGHVSDHSKKLPADLISAIAAAKKANAGIFNKRQCILGLFDQHIHTCSVADSSKVDTAKAFEQISAENWPIVPTPGTNFAAGFGHLAGGYDSQYYGSRASSTAAAGLPETRAPRFRACQLLSRFSISHTCPLLSSLLCCFRQDTCGRRCTARIWSEHEATCEKGVLQNQAPSLLTPPNRCFFVLPVPPLVRLSFPEGGSAERGHWPELSQGDHLARRQRRRVRHAAKLPGARTQR